MTTFKRGATEISLFVQNACAHFLELHLASGGWRRELRGYRLAMVLRMPCGLVVHGASTGMFEREGEGFIGRLVLSFPVPQTIVHNVSRAQRENLSNRR